MPLFQYQALDARGKKRKGIVEANSEKDARNLLRDQGSMVVKIQPQASISSRQNLKGANLSAFTMQLSQLIDAGMPMYESLLALEEQYRGESYHRVILSLCEQIKSGSTLSDAMGSFPDSFDKLYRSMIHAGESAGALNIVLEKLSHYLNRQMKLRKSITTAMIYPAILGCFSLVVICLLLGFVVPSIEAIFADRQLNGFTEFVLKLSRLFRSYWWAFFPVVGSLVAYAIYKIKRPEGRLWLEKVSINLPLIKNLVVQTSVGRFCRTMGTLQQGGLSMIDSLRISRDVMRNVVLEEEIKRAENKIVEGSSLSVELGHSTRIPHMVARMLAVGEESGSFVVMLNKIADMYEEELEKSLERLMALAQPVILMVMGTIIGVVLIAILLPLTDVSSFSL